MSGKSREASACAGCAGVAAKQDGGQTHSQRQESRYSPASSPSGTWSSSTMLTMLKGASFGASLLTQNPKSPGPGASNWRPVEHWPPGSLCFS